MTTPLLVKFSQSEHGRFIVEIPSFFSLDKFTREDLTGYIKDNLGYWTSGQCWSCPLEAQKKLFRIFSADFNAKVAVSLPESRVVSVAPVTTIVMPPTPKILVQVPTTIVAPKPTQAENAIIARQYEKIKKALLQLHEDTGVNKTVMRKLLSETVPAQRHSLLVG